MGTTLTSEHDTEAQVLAGLARIEMELSRHEFPKQEKDRPGLMGRLFGKAPSFGSDERLMLESSSEVEARVAVIVAYRLLHAQRREIAQILPEALYEGEIPGDDEERFMLFASTAREVVRQHLSRDVLNTPSDEVRAIKLLALADALEDDSVEPLAERLHRHLNAGLVERGRDIELVREDALLIEVDNIMLGDVDEHGRMAYGMDVVVDGHPLATVASVGDGTIEVLNWLGEHGPEDLEALRDYVARFGEPRSDEHGERPDSLEELLLDRVSSLLARYAFQDARSDAVLFCDAEETAPGGHVIRVAPIGPELDRLTVMAIVIEEYPEAVLLDAIDADDAFTLWLAYSTV